MAFQEIPANADISSIIQLVNNVIRELNNQEVTKLYKTTDGKRGIILGKLPDGTEGLVIAKSGYDVISDVFA